MNVELCLQKTKKICMTRSPFRKFGVDNKPIKFYYISMKNSKRVMIFISALLVAVLAFSLAGCLKIGMRERNIRQRLEDAGAELSYEKIAPMLRGGTAGQLNSIGTVLGSYMSVKDRNADTNEEVEHEDMLYVIFAKTDSAGDWAEDCANAWLDKQLELRQNGEEDPDGDVKPEWALDKWNVYRYDNVIMCGHYQILKVARTY